MTDSTQELDEIIDDAYEGEVSWTHDQLDGTSVLDDSLKDIDERKAETKQALLDWHKKHELQARIDGKRQGLNFSKSFIIPTLQSMKLNRKQISTIETLFSDASTSINEDRKQELEKL